MSLACVNLKPIPGISEKLWRTQRPSARTFKWSVQLVRPVRRNRSTTTSWRGISTFRRSPITPPKLFVSFGRDDKNAPIRQRDVPHVLDLARTNPEPATRLGQYRVS